MKRFSMILFAAAIILALQAVSGLSVAQASEGAAESALPEQPLALALPDLNPLPLANPEAARGVKWIDINISRQTISAYMGSTLIKRVLVSTGTWRHPTVVGRFRVYAKVHSQTMSGGSRAAGDYYYLPGVPHVMYFYQGYAIHGTYWHRNFGHRMSHGCVNLTLASADWFYSWTPYSTLVVTHY